MEYEAEKENLLFDVFLSFTLINIPFFYWMKKNTSVTFYITWGVINTIYILYKLFIPTLSRISIDNAFVIFKYDSFFSLRKRTISHDISFLKVLLTEEVTSIRSTRKRFVLRIRDIDTKSLKIKLIEGDDGFSSYVLEGLFKDILKINPNAKAKTSDFIY